MEVARPRPLAETDNRGAFDCGRESMNLWLRRHGWANHAAGVSRVNVICETATNSIVGYVTLSAAQIERASLPKARQRNMPDPLPVTLLGQLAIHKEWQGQGYAEALLLFALRLALRVSYDVASWGVITHPIDDGVRSFYARYGFQELPFDLRRAMAVHMADLERSNLLAGSE